MKKAMTVTVDTEVIKRAREMCYWHPALNMSNLVEKSLTRYMDNFDNSLNTLDKAVAADIKLKRGRPVYMVKDE